MAAVDGIHAKTKSEDVIADMIRQLQKAIDVLQNVDVMMRSEATMNAAKHLATEPLPNPLAAKVRTILQDLERSIQRYEGDEE